jgi:hypothetical protein
MRIYSHRVNSKLELQEIAPNFGVEIDIRSRLGELILSHDPFADGELLAEWLTCWNGQPLILNMKEDSLEDAVLELLLGLNVTDFFFLDQSYPSIRRLLSIGVSKVATRVSDFEDEYTALKSGSDWVWLDSFTGDWNYLPSAVKRISENGQKTCLVSPELQRLNSGQELAELKELIELHGIKISAVCTKFIKSWP